MSALTGDTQKNWLHGAGVVVGRGRNVKSLLAIGVGVTEVTFGISSRLTFSFLCAGLSCLLRPLLQRAR